MTTLHLMKTAQGVFAPATEVDVELARRFKVGSVQRCEIAEMRNGKFFRKWWVLVQFAFDIWSGRMPDQEWKGVPVLPNFERFRKDVTIMAGFMAPVWNVKGELRVEAESISWSKMTEERFDQLYSKTISVILEKIIPNAGFSEDTLRSTVDQLLGGFS